MTVNRCALILASVAAATAGFEVTVVHADINGFNNLVGWQYNQGDAGTPADMPDPDTIHLTNLGTAQRRSVFNLTPQPVGPFTASFTYQVLNAGIFGCDYGATFVIQNSSEGATALGGADFGMGYSGIDNSIAVSLELQNNASGFYMNGEVRGSGPSVAPLSLVSGHELNVVLTYDGTLLTQMITDTVTLEEHNRTFDVGDLSSVIGSPTAFVGFTGSTTEGACSGNAANQFFSDFHFTSVPEPTALSLLVCGCAFVFKRRRP